MNEDRKEKIVSEIINKLESIVCTREEYVDLLDSVLFEVGALKDDVLEGLKASGALNEDNHGDPKKD